MDRRLFERQLMKFKLLSNADNFDAFLISEGRKENARAIASNLNDEQFQELLDGDPSKDSPQNPYKYIEWMAKQARNQYKIEDIVGLTTVYHNNVQAIPKDMPLQNFKTLRELYDFISALDSSEDIRDIEGNLYSDESKKEEIDLVTYIKKESDKYVTVFEDDENLVVRVINVEGSCELGKHYNVKWCLSGGLAGDAYAPDKAKGHFNSYVGSSKVLYFIAYKNVEDTSEKKIYALIMNISNPPLVDSMWDRKDHRIDHTVWSSRDRKNKQLLKLITDYTSNATVMSKFTEEIKSVNTVEDLIQILDKYAKITNEEQFKALFQQLKHYISPRILEKARLKFNSISSIDQELPTEGINKLSKTSLFVTKNLNIKSITSIGLAFKEMKKHQDENEYADVSKIDLYDAYTNFLNSYFKFHNTLQPTQYLFMLKKLSNIELNVNELAITRNNIIDFSETGQPLFYTVILPLFTVKKVDYSSNNTAVPIIIPKLVITGVNTKILEVLKSELSKKDNIFLRRIFGFYADHLNTPLTLQKTADNDEELRFKNRIGNLGSFIADTKDESFAFHEREVSREILDVIAKTPYSSMTADDVNNTLSFTKLDLTSAHTANSRKLVAQEFKKKLPKLLQVMKANFNARKPFIEGTFKDNKKKVNSIFESENNQTHQITGIYADNVFLKDLQVNEILSGLNKEEISKYLYDNQIMNFNGAVAHYDGKIVPALSVFLDRNFNMLGGLFGCYNARQLATYLNIMVGPEYTVIKRGSKVGTSIFTEEDRIKIALSTYEVLGGFPTSLSFNEILGSFGPSRQKIEGNEDKINKISDYIYSTIFKNTYIDETEMYKYLIDLFKNNVIQNYNKKDASTVKGIVANFSKIFYDKILEHIQYSTLLLENTTLTRNYGGEYKIKYENICKERLKERAANYEIIVNELMESINQLGIKKTSGVMANDYSGSPVPNIYNLRSNDIKILPNCVQVFKDLTSKFESQNQNLSESRKLVVRLKNGR